eukprot:1159189-Pelagomonas_calceolata.AAC.4
MANASSCMRRCEPLACKRSLNAYGACVHMELEHSLPVGARNTDQARFGACCNGPLALMIKRELAKDPALAQENWDRQVQFQVLVLRVKGGHRINRDLQALICLKAASFEAILVWHSESVRQHSARQAGSERHPESVCQIPTGRMHPESIRQHLTGRIGQAPRVCLSAPDRQNVTGTQSLSVRSRQAEADRHPEPVC